MDARGEKLNGDFDRIEYYRNRPPVSRERYHAILEKAGNDEPPRPGDEMTPELERIAKEFKKKRR